MRPVYFGSVVLNFALLFRLSLIRFFFDYALCFYLCRCVHWLFLSVTTDERAKSASLSACFWLTRTSSQISALSGLLWFFSLRCLFSLILSLSSLSFCFISRACCYRFLINLLFSGLDLLSSCLQSSILCFVLFVLIPCFPSFRFWFSHGLLSRTSRRHSFLPVRICFEDLREALRSSSSLLCWEFLDAHREHAVHCQLQIFAKEINYSPFRFE